MAVAAAVAKGPRGGTGEAARRAILTPVSWEARSGLAFGEWAEAGRQLGLLGRAAAWWIGDWLRFGNAAYGERYVRAARITGYDLQTLKNMVYVAARFDPSRRRDDLTWSHHAEVAALEPTDRDRWLARAVRERMSVRCLRKEIRCEQRAAAQANGRRALDRPSAHAGAPSPVPDREDASDVVCPECGHAFAFARCEVDAAAHASG